MERSEAKLIAITAHVGGERRLVRERPQRIKDNLLSADNTGAMCILDWVVSSLPPHAGRLSAAINEPGGPFADSGAVILQTESPRNITIVTAHTYEISCSSSMGVTPVWRRNDSIVTNSPPTSGTPGVYVREPANHERVLVLQNVTQSVVGTFVCLEGSGQDADIVTFAVTTGKGVQL